MSLVRLAALMGLVAVLAPVTVLPAQQGGAAGTGATDTAVPAAAELSKALAATTIAAGDMLLTMWEPSESYEGRAQADARLDRPVQLWRPGMPLREVLQELSQQTGVGFGFWPADAEEGRVCTTLYLNPQQPPSLRSVMAQLSWVTGCGFAYPQGQGEDRTYYLLGSSAGQGVAEKLEADSQALREQFRGQWEERREADRKAAAAALEESRRALALSRNELINRYRGSNDALLLNLLDPQRRAAVTLIAGLPRADLDELFSGSGMVSRQWSEWSPAQQAALTQALGLEGRLPQEGEVYVSVGADWGGSVVAFVRSDRRPRFLGRIGGLLSTGNVRGDEEVALRRQLGEIRTPQQEQALRQEEQQAREAARAAGREQWAQQRAQATAATRALSPAAQSALSSLTLPEGSWGRDLWQLQEAVAKATGMNVISDCFWPPQGPFAGPPRRGGPGQSASALEALSTACSGGPGGFSPPLGGGAGEDLSMQWGDAGTFLRFRSRHPEVWRAAMLPAKVQAQLDSWLEPHVAAAGGSPQAEAPGPRRGGRGGPRQQVSDAPLAGDLEKLSWLAGHLNDLQLRLGGLLPYEDPSDPRGMRLQAMRRATLAAVGMRVPFLRLMATFSPEQWTQARSKGLRWGYDLTPEQRAALISGMPGGMAPGMGRGAGPATAAGAASSVFGPSVPENRANDVLLQIGQTESQTIQLPDGTQNTIPPAPALKFLLDGRAINQIVFSAGWWGGRPGP
jgi:hypothetical protein